MKSKSCFIWTFLLSAAVCLVAFQNCSKNFGGQNFDSSPSVEKSSGSNLLPSEPPVQVAGNGEGYGGKVIVYASVDSDNRCGKANEYQIPVRDKIEVHEDGTAFKVMENCQPITPAKAIPQGQVESSSQDRSLMVVNNLIFESAPWANQEFVSRDQYVSIFCSGTSSKESQKDIDKKMEMFVYKSTQSLAYEMPWLPDFTFLNQIFYRTGVVHLYEIDRQSQQIMSEQSAMATLQESVMPNIFNGSLDHDLQLVSDPQALSDFLKFNFQFTSLANAPNLLPNQLDFLLSSSNTSTDVNKLKCWSDP